VRATFMADRNPMHGSDIWPMHGSDIWQVEAATGEPNPFVDLSPVHSEWRW